MRSLVTSSFLYVCESWTLTAELQRRIQAMGMRCYRKILRISYKDHVTNEEVRAKIQQAIGRHEDLLTIVNRHKLKWCGHVSHSSGLAKTILRVRQADRRRGGKTTSGNGQAQSSPSLREQWRTGDKWRKLVAKSSVVLQRASRLRDRWWWWWWWWWNQQGRVKSGRLKDTFLLAHFLSFFHAVLS